VIAKTIIDCNIKEKLYLFDTFTGVPTAGEQDTAYRGGEHADASVETVEECLNMHSLLDVVEIHKGLFPTETGDVVKNLPIRFCHFDMDIYKSTEESFNFV